jgi:predicted DNA-binding antitoxin AbrB/MazE fold protein
MQKTIEAIYENGVLRPVQPLDWLEEKRQVTVTVTTPDPQGPLNGWVGGISDEDATLMRRVIDEEFGQVNPDDWK